MIPASGTISTFQAVPRSIQTRVAHYENAGFLFQDVPSSILTAQGFDSISDGIPKKLDTVKMRIPSKTLIFDGIRQTLIGKLSIMPMLDSIFRLCKSESFEGKLKKLHDKSYKIDDLLSIHVNRIHPLELVANSLSFQNIANIEYVFSTLTNKPFFKQVKQLRSRVKENPEIEYQIDQSDIEIMQEVFEERHLLIHNPSRSLSKSLASTEERINSILGVVASSDLVLRQFINENIDPEILSNISSNLDGDKAAAVS